MGVNNLPVPSGPGKNVTVGDVAKSAGKAVMRSAFPRFSHWRGWHQEQQPPNQVQKREDPNKAVQRHIEHPNWTAEDLKGYIEANGGQLPPFMQPGYKGESKQGDSNVTYNINITNHAPAPVPAEPQGRSVGQVAGDIALGGLVGTGQITWWLLKKLLSSGDKERQRQHEIQLALIEASKKQNSDDGGWKMVVVVCAILSLLVVCSALARPWHYWDYGGPVIIHHDYGRY